MQEFDRYVDLPADLRFVPVRQIGSMVFRAAEEAGVSDDAAFVYGFHVGPEYIANRVRHWRDAGKLRVFMLEGLGTLDDDDVLQGVLRREDFAAFAADEFHAGVTEPAVGRLTRPIGTYPTGPAGTKDEPAPLSATAPADALALGVATGKAAPLPTAPSKASPIAPEPAGGPVAHRRNWWDVASPYMVATLRAGQYATAKELSSALTAGAGKPDSPFDKGEGQNRGSLFVREIGKPLSLKTIRNNWQKLRGAARS